jgi:predicted aspartyl protease
VNTTQAWVDHKRRPVVLVQRVGSSEPFLAVVDTGCSLPLLVDPAVANELGVVKVANVRRDWDHPPSIRQADGKKVPIEMGQLAVVWNGHIQTVAVGIIPGGVMFPDDGAWPDTEPKALLGCQMMATSTLTINFCRHTIEIGDCAPRID